MLAINFYQLCLHGSLMAWPRELSWGAAAGAASGNAATAAEPPPRLCRLKFGGGGPEALRLPFWIV
jgi:hypothetical protein